MTPERDLRDTPLPSERGAISQLDAIRVVAMLGVFSHHLWKTVIPVPHSTFQQFLNPAFEAMTGSVVIFNIISGFLLSLPHLGPEHRPVMNYGTFLRKRFLRIIPPYYLALLLFTAANMLRFDYPPAPALKMLLEHVLFVNSLDYSNMLTNFSHFWYLGLLAQFYLLFPLILRYFIRLGPARAALSICVLCWGSWQAAAWFIPEYPNAPPGQAEIVFHFNLPGRLPEFATGMWLASMWKNTPERPSWKILDKTFLTYSAALGLLFLFSTPFYSDLLLPALHLYGVGFTLIVFLFLLFWPPAARAGHSKALKKFAAQTYVIYIVHHPLFSYVGVTPQTVTHSIPNFLLLSALILPLCYVVAVLVTKGSDLIIDSFSRLLPTAR